MSDSPAPGEDEGSGVGPIDRAPTYLSSTLALLAAVSTAVLSAYAPVALGSALVGLLVLAVGLGLGRQQEITVGGGLLVVGVVAAGTSGAPVSATVLGMTSALLAFDTATTAVGLGEQLGREATTSEVELFHAAASTAVGLGVVVPALAIREAATGGQPVSAVFGLLVVVLLSVVVLRRADPLSGQGA
jgi:hypothetical protein